MMSDDHETEARHARYVYDAAARKVANLAPVAVCEAFIAGAPGLQLAIDVANDLDRPPTSERLRLIARDATDKWLRETLRAIDDALTVNERSQHDGAERLRERAKTLDYAYERIRRYIPAQCPRDAKTVILRDTQTGLFIRATPLRETKTFVEYSTSAQDGGCVRVTKLKAGRYVVWWQ